MGDGDAGLDVGDSRGITRDGDIRETAGVGRISLHVGDGGRFSGDSDDGRASQVGLVFSDGRRVASDSDKPISRG